MTTRDAGALACRHINACIDDKMSAPGIEPLDANETVSLPAEKDRGKRTSADMTHNGSEQVIPVELTDLEKQSIAETPTRPPPDDPNLVVFNGPDDPGNPMNWPVRKRTFITMAMGGMTFVVTFSSSIFASTLVPVTEEFNIDEVTATLGVALFLLVRESHCDSRA